MTSLMLMLPELTSISSHFSFLTILVSDGATKVQFASDEAYLGPHVVVYLQAQVHSYRLMPD